VPAPDDLEGWRQYRALMESRVKADNASAIMQYQPTIAPRKLGEIPVLDIRPQGWRDNGKVIIYLHGGAYTMFSARSSLITCAPVAQVIATRVIAVDYTTVPFSKWTRTPSQVIAVIKALLKGGYSHNDIGLLGDSSGGGLVVSTVLKMKDEGLDTPSALVLWSPWADITETGDSYATLKDADPAYRYAVLKPSADACADPKDQKHPYVSPVYGNFRGGFPPTLIQGAPRRFF
jgi:epsilon-lactone hydrolase